MGYTTEFNGVFELDRRADAHVSYLIDNLNRTRRVKRNVPHTYGVEGAFYFGDHNSNIIDNNQPPVGQPGLWCGWRLDIFGFCIEWDGSEKFYNYIEWLEYIIKHVLIPHNYKLNGRVEFQGEYEEDGGEIVVEDNKVRVERYY